MKNLRNIVNSNLLAVFTATTMLFPVAASSNDTPFKKDPLVKEEGYLEFSVGLVQMSTQVATQQNGIDCGDSIMVG